MKQTMPLNAARNPLSRALKACLPVGMGIMLTTSGLVSANAEVPAAQQLDGSIMLTSWSNGGEKAGAVAAAQVSGLYAVADEATHSIEIRNIAEQLKSSISHDDLLKALPEADLDKDICGMTFTPSGRFLFFAVCGKGKADDAVMAFNTNTKELSVFDRVSLSDGEASIGMTYFKDQLFVGSEKGIYIYEAGRNTVYEGGASGRKRQVASNTPVTGMTMDLAEGQLYATTQDGLYRLDGRNLKQIAKAENLQAVTMGRVYGGENNGGLYLLQNDGNDARILSVALETLRKSNTVDLSVYTEKVSAELKDIAATADGRMMLAQEQVQIMFDSSDSRLGYKDWLHDELDEYLKAIKSLIVDGDIEGTNNLAGGHAGQITRMLQRDSANGTPIADNVGWTMYLLMAIDQVKNDPDIELLLERIIETHAGLSEHLYGGVRTVDGHFVRVYNRDGLPNPGVNGRGYLSSQPQVYVSMKYLPAAYKAAELYPDNEKFKVYAEYLRQLVKRSSDTIRAEQRITWTLDDHGPLDINNLMANETWIFGDIGAAQDPYVSTDYEAYSYHRDSFRTDDWLKGEPTIMSSHAAFIVNGATLILNHHFDGEGWLDQNHNYYATTMAATDEMGAPYFGGFSAGSHPNCRGGNKRKLPACGYYNDGPSDRPNQFLHFPAALGFGQHGFSASSVGGYMAYRDGRRQEMHNSAGGEPINMLTRWSMDFPEYGADGIGIADFWFGGIGLVETIKPGTVEKFRGDFYRPYVKEEDGQLIYSNMTPRRVVGIDADGTRTEYGFQMAPYTLPATHADYEVVDPEGDWIELEDLVAQLDGQPMRFTNPHFARELDNWTVLGNGSADIIDGIGSKAVALTANGETAISQPLELTMDLEDTRFVVRAMGQTLNADKGEGYLRLRWSADGDLANVVGETEISDRLTADNQQQSFMIKTHKPRGASYLHIEYVAEGENDQFAFENIAVMRRGADGGLENGDFSNDAQHWTVRGGAKVERNRDMATAGDRVLKFSRRAGQQGWQNVQRDINISEDPLGTRYLFRFDANTVGEGFKFEVVAEAFDRSGERMVERRDIGDIQPGHNGEYTFTLRKRPGYDYLTLTFRMRRNDRNSKGTAEVYMDNFRMDLERVFDEADCVMDSATGCMPTRLDLSSR